MSGAIEPLNSKQILFTISFLTLTHLSSVNCVPTPRVVHKAHKNGECLNLQIPRNTSERVDGMTVKLLNRTTCVAVYDSYECTGQHVQFREEGVSKQWQKLDLDFDKNNSLADFLINPLSLKPSACRASLKDPVGLGRSGYQNHLHLIFEKNKTDLFKSGLTSDANDTTCVKLTPFLRYAQGKTSQSDSLTLKVENEGDGTVVACIELFSGSGCDGPSFQVTKTLQGRKTKVFWNLLKGQQDNDSERQTQVDNEHEQQGKFLMHSAKLCALLEEDISQDDEGGIEVELHRATITGKNSSSSVSTLVESFLIVTLLSFANVVK